MGNLTTPESAIVAAVLNETLPLDELGAAFEHLLADSSLVGRPIVIDLGCGPFTAGLALAATLGPGRTFRYYGVDRAAAMRSLGSRFASAAKALGGLQGRTTWWFADDLGKADFGRIRGDLKIVVASYLLASPSLNVDELVGTVLHTLQRIGPGPTAVLYTNSAEPTPNAKYPACRDGFCRSGFEVKADEVATFSATKNPKRFRYALFFKQADAGVPVGKLAL